jgi:hypothetical protein
MDVREERKPRNLRDFDYHHEKVALTRMAQWLKTEGWSEVKLSVSPKALSADGDLVGKEPMSLDAAFVTRFNADWRYRYNFYRDEPGNFDLVARRAEETLIVEGKGQSAGNKRGAIAQMVGSLSLERDPLKPNRRYAILIPDGPVWDKGLRNHGGLTWLELYRIEANRPGNIRQDSWTNYETGTREGSTSG